MSDNQQPPSKAPRERSPSFPFIPLKTAINRLREFEGKFGRNPPPADRVYLAWGYKGDTSQAQQTIAALKAFGLVKYNGSGPKRTISISDDARTYLRANQDSIKHDVLKKIALQPSWLARMWDQWGSKRHPDEVCLDELVLRHKFNENAAPTFLRVYDETIAYAGLSDSDKVTPENDENAGGEVATDFQVGNLINWESDGQVQWNQPRKIIGIDEHGNGQFFYQVEGLGDLAGQKGSIPVEQAIQHEQVAAPNATFTLLSADPKGDNLALKDGSRKAVFPIEDGDVTLIFPKTITSEGLEELGRYLDIFLKNKQKKSGA